MEGYGGVWGRTPSNRKLLGPSEAEGLGAKPPATEGKGVSFVTFQ